MACIVRLDIVEGKPRTFVCSQELENGVFLEIKGKAENVELGIEADYEAYKVVRANASTKRGQLLFHASVENMYDERLLKKDFVLPAKKCGRGYQLVLGDIVTIPAIDDVEVNDELKLGADGKLVKTDANDGICVVEALENIEIPIGANDERDVQDSMVIRFF